MKKLSLILVCCFLLSGCAFISKVKHIESDIIGLDRTITLYNANGQTIKQWNTRSKVEDRGGSCSFIVAGKTVIISGTFIIEEN